MPKAAQTIAHTPRPATINELLSALRKTGQFEGIVWVGDLFRHFGIRSLGDLTPEQAREVLANPGLIWPELLHDAALKDVRAAHQG